MNKKGFTLVELLSTLVILSIIAVIAIPNVVRIISNNNKSKVLNDGIALIAQAKKKLAGDYELREQIDATGYNYTLQALDEYSDITNDPKGSAYNRSNSHVKVYKRNNHITYCVYLESDNWTLENSGTCIDEADLFSDNAKNYVKES